MTRYAPLEGIVTSIASFPSQISPCTLILTLRGSSGAINNLVLEPSTYVYNQEPIRTGDTIIAFYDTTAPVPLIYPPQYRAVAIVRAFPGQSAMLDVFDQNQRNSDNTLQLNLASTTNIRTQNGQLYPGSLSGQFLLVLYSTTTKSIPAQTTPETIVVFCGASAS